MCFRFCSNHCVVENKYKKNKIQHFYILLIFIQETNLYSCFIEYYFNILSIVQHFDIMLQHLPKMLNYFIQNIAPILSIVQNFISINLILQICWSQDIQQKQRGKKKSKAHLPPDAFFGFSWASRTHARGPEILFIFHKMKA